MAGRQKSTFQKRQKEAKRLEKQRQKAEKRAARRLEKAQKVEVPGGRPLTINEVRPRVERGGWVGEGGKCRGGRGGRL
jgi:hypothetical protein